MLRLVSSAKSRQDIKSGLVNKRDDLLEHLVRYYMFPDIDTHHHWTEEIVRDTIHRVSPFKGSHRYPSKEFILNALWVEAQDEIKDIWHKECTGHREEPAKIPYSRFYMFSRAYIEWLAGELAVHGSVDYNRIRAKLKELSGYEE